MATKKPSAAKAAPVKAAAVSAMAAFVTSAPAVQKAAVKKPVAKKVANAVAKPVAKKPKTPIAAPIKFSISIGRPAAGRALFAHTMAFLELSGMYNGGIVDKAHAAKVIGATAIAYHLNTKKTFEMRQGGLAISSHGFDFFAARIIDGDLDQGTCDIFKDVLTTGKADGTYVRNDKAIVTI